MNAEPTITSAVPLASGSITRRLHPLSLIFEMGHLVRSNLIPAVFASFSAASGGVIGAAVGSVVFGAAILIAVFRYLTFRYTITESNLLVDQGLIFRQHRSVPIERIQNIDSVQNLLHRWLGVAEVRIETASGNEPEATMRVITVAEVERLRQRLSRKTQPAIDQPEPADNAMPTLIAAGLDNGNDNRADLSLDTGADTSSTVASTAGLADSAASTHVVLQLTTPQLIAAGLLSNRGWVLASVILGYFWQAAFRGWDSSFEDEYVPKIGMEELGSFRELYARIISYTSNGMVLALVAVATLISCMLVLKIFSAIWFVLKFYGYELVLRGDDLVIRCGLLTKVSATVPRSRIQVVSVQRSLSARWFGWASVRLETLGGGGKEEEDASATVARQWFIPILSEKDLPQVLSQIRPDLTWTNSDTPWRPLSKWTFARMIRLPTVVCLLFALIGVGWMIWSARIGSAMLIGSLAMLVCFIAICRRKSKSRKYARNHIGFVYRSGTLLQKTSFGFWNRLQNVDLVQSPFDRRWRMASLRLDTAGAGAADHELLVEYLNADHAEAEYRAILDSIGSCDPTIR